MDDAAAALTRVWRGARREDATRDPVGHASRSEEGAACMVVLSTSDWLRRPECMSTWRAPGSHFDSAVGTAINRRRKYPNPISRGGRGGARSMSLAGSHLHQARSMRADRGSFLGAALLLVLLAGLAGDLGHSSRGIGKHGRSASGVHTLQRRSREAVALDATGRGGGGAGGSSRKARGVDPCAGERASGSGDPSEANGVVALVTGGAGFIGSHLSDELLRLGYRVRVLDNLSTGKAEYVDSRVDFIDGDVRDADACERAMRPWGAAATDSTDPSTGDPSTGDPANDPANDEKAAVAVVFHLAAMSKVGPSLHDPDMVKFCVENNVVGTANVLRAALRAKTVRKVSLF